MRAALHQHRALDGFDLDPPHAVDDDGIVQISASSPTVTVAGVDVDDVALGPASGQSEALALADRDESTDSTAPMRSPVVSTTVAGRNAMRSPRKAVRPPVEVMKQTLAVGLVGRAQVDRRGPAARTSAFCIPPTGNTVGELCLVEHVDHVALILRRVGTTLEGVAPSTVRPMLA